MMHHLAMIAAVAGTGICAIVIAARVIDLHVKASRTDDIDWENAQ